MKITFTELKQTIEKLAEESPDCVYEQPVNSICSYRRGICSNGSSGCIIGQACRSLGLSENELIDMDTYGAFMNVCTSKKFRERFFLTCSELLWITTVQKEQDDRNSWSRAVSEANKKNASLVWL